MENAQHRICFDRDLGGNVNYRIMVNCPNCKKLHRHSLGKDPLTQTGTSRRSDCGVEYTFIIKYPDNQSLGYVAEVALKK